MQISELYSIANSQISMDDIEPMTAGNYRQFDGSMSYAEIVDYFELKGLNPDYIYTVKPGVNSINQFWYIDQPAFINIPGFSEGLLDMVFKPGKAEDFKRTVKRFWDEGEYISFFYLMPKEFTLWYFKNRYKEIEKEKLGDVFIYLYTNSHYGFDMLSMDEYREILSCFTKKSDVFVTRTDGMVDIWRGQGDKSTDWKQSISWTTNLNVALSFADRFHSSKAKLLHTTVPESAIKAYIDSGEDEVLIFPEDITGKVDDSFLNAEAVMPEIASAGVHNEYHYLKDSFLKRKMFRYDAGNHDMKHTKRVLLLSLVLAHYEKLDVSERFALGFCAIHHDIGRRNDFMDDSHGAASAVIVKEKLLWERFMMQTHITPVFEPIVIDVIKYHCVDDDIGIQAIRDNEDIHNKDLAIKLYRLFKDADALDRVRLRDLDYSYLRTKSAKKLPLFAWQLLNGLK